VAPERARARAAELRALAAARGDAHAVRRDGAIADVVLLARRTGRFTALTEDYLTVGIVAADGPPPARFHARLARGGEGVTALPIAS
jgi:hypothetical protein